MAQITLKCCADRYFGNMVEDVLDCFYFPLRIKVDFSYKYNSKTRWSFREKNFKLITLRGEISISWPSISTSINETEFIKKQKDVDKLVTEINNWSPEDILNKHAQFRGYAQSGSDIRFLGMLAVEIYVTPLEPPAFRIHDWESTKTSFLLISLYSLNELFQINVFCM